MANNKQEDKEIQDIIKDITATAKDLVEEYVSGSDNFVPEEERTELNEKGIGKQDNSSVPFNVTDEEMEHLLNVQNEIKDIINDNPDIYIGRGEKDIKEGKFINKGALLVFQYCRDIGTDNFNIFEYIGDDKEKLRECLRIKTKK
tara:strand:- start:38 stop:472 length:435 start_codon:yes stop_codon:yes gene_type:complete